MGRFAWLLAIIFVGLAGYNYWQVTQLREELKIVKTQVQVLKNDKTRKRVADFSKNPVEVIEKSAKAKKAAKGKKADDGLSDVFAEIKTHSKKAEALIAKGKYREAKQELDKGLAQLEKASKYTSGFVETAQDGLGQTWSKLRYEARKAWKDISVDKGKVQ